MITELSGFPDDVLAISISGEVTAEDYHNVLIPRASAKLKAHDHLRIYCELGPAFKGMTASAMWEDTKLGIGHWGEWGRAAIVTDIGWIVTMTRFFAPLFPAPMRVFSHADEGAAREWLMAKD